MLTEDGYDFSALDYAHGYFGADWYQIPASTRKDRWSDPYFDAGGGEFAISHASFLLLPIAPLFIAPQVMSGWLHTPSPSGMDQH